LCRHGRVEGRPAWLARSVAPPQLRHARRPARVPNRRKETRVMVLLGIDPHKDTHTVVAVDQAGRQLDQTTVPARTLGHGHLVS
jgi:hypothetical protein